MISLINWCPQKKKKKKFTRSKSTLMRQNMIHVKQLNAWFLLQGLYIPHCFTIELVITGDKKHEKKTKKIKMLKLVGI